MATERGIRALNRAGRKSPVSRNDREQRLRERSTARDNASRASSQRRTRSRQVSQEIESEIDGEDAAEGSVTQAPAASEAPSTQIDRLIDDENVEDLDADMLELVLPDLDRDTDRILDEILPEDSSRDFQTDYFADSKTRKRVDLRRKAFQNVRRHYTGDRSYIQPQAILRKLFAGVDNVEQLLNGCRPDHILYKANIAQLLIDMLLVQQKPETRTLERIENNFPSAIAGPAFANDGFNMAVSLTSQVVIARLEEADPTLSTEEFHQIITDSFMSETSEMYRHWEALEAQSLVRRSQNQLQTRIKKHIDNVCGLFDGKHEVAEAIDELRRMLPWSAFKIRLLAYCRDRRLRLNKEITSAGGAAATQEAIRQALESRESREPTLAAQEIAPVRASTGSKMEYSSSGVAHMKKMRRLHKKTPQSVLQNVQEDDEDDIENAEHDRNRIFGRPGPSRGSGSNKRSHATMISSPAQQSIDVSQDRGPQPMSRQATSVVSRQRHTPRDITPNHSNNELEAVEDDAAAHSENARRLLEDMNLKLPNPALYNHEKRRYWTKREEDRVKFLVEYLGEAGRHILGRNIKEVDDGIASFDGNLVSELNKRSAADIKDKLRLLKKEILL